MQNNGGPTETHALVADSPAIDIASVAGCAAAPVDGTDQRGYIRSVDVPGVGNDGTDYCDAGAYEYDAVPPSACPVSPVDGTVGTSTTFLLGTGMGSPNRTRMVSKITIPNASTTTALFGQMAAKSYPGVKFVRFIYPNKTYEQIQTVTDLGDNGAVSWWGADLDISRLTRPFVKGRWFLYPGAKRDHLPRALVLYVTQTTAEEYASNWSTFTYPDNFVAETPAFNQTSTNTLAIPETQETADITVQVAIADINNDPRTVDLTISAGGISETVTLTGPISKKMELLNLVEVTLEDVPAGTDEVEILMESALGSGDSAALLGAAASFACTMP
ncbi:MAG: choice-of-anchor Q domain-containing protein [Chloroflexota bacterium]